MTKSTSKDLSSGPLVEKHHPIISIGEAARLTSLSVSALRKYESLGLIVFHRTEGRRRMVSIEDVDRIKLIRSLIKTKGLNLEGILRLWALIPCWDLKQCSTLDVQNCPAANQSLRPCWVVLKFEGCSYLPSCATCEVYRLSARCTEQIKPLIMNQISPPR